MSDRPDPPEVDPTGTDTPPVARLDAPVGEMEFETVTLHPNWAIFRRDGRRFPTPDDSPVFQAVPREVVEKISTLDLSTLRRGPPLGEPDAPDEALPFVDPEFVPEHYDQLTISNGGEPAPYGDGTLLGRVWTSSDPENYRVIARALRSLAMSLEQRAPDDARDPDDSEYEVVGRNSDGEAIDP